MQFSNISRISCLLLYIVSTCVLADDTLQDNLQEKRAKFILSMRNRRRHYYESAIVDHYNSRMVDTNTTSASRKRKKSIRDYFLHQSDMEHRLGNISPIEMSTLQMMQKTEMSSFPPMPKSRISSNIEKIKEMFQHAYDSYMYNGYPWSELRPLTCQGGLFDLVRLPVLTLIDTLDMLLIMNNYTEFARSVERLRYLDEELKSDVLIAKDSMLQRGGLFAQDQNVSVFETNIRVLGGLLSAHQMVKAWDNDNIYMDEIFDDDNNVRFGYDVNNLINDCPIGDEQMNPTASESPIPCSRSQKEGTEICSSQEGSAACSATSMDVDINESNEIAKKSLNTSKSDQVWVYDDFLLELAKDIGDRLLPAYQTPTGIPYGTVNLLYGIPKDETPIASLAGGGTLTLEMELLSRLTQNEVYGKVAKLSMRALFSRRSKLGLLGKHINVIDGQWTEKMAGVGSNSDSMYEYLIKHHILFPEDEDFFDMFNITFSGIHKNARLGDWYPDVPMTEGLNQPNSVFESLASFYPGMQILLGELNPAARSVNAFSNAREAGIFLPERFDFAQFESYHGHQQYPLRPELYESNYFLHRLTKDLGLTSTSGWLWNADFFLHDLDKYTKTPCGFATLKGISSKDRGAKLSHHNEMPSYFLSETLKYLYLTFNDENPIDMDKERSWIFTTEAHPIHYAPPIHPKNGRGDDWTDNAREEVLAFVDDLISTDHSPSDAEPIQSRHLSHVRYLHKEKWAMLSGKFPHIRDLAQIDSLTHRGSGINTHSKQTMGRFTQRRPYGVDIDENDAHFFNYGYLYHDRDGRGSHIEKSCPNYHQSNSLWIQALQGNDIDFHQVFEPTMSSSYFSTIPSKVGSSSSATGLFGTTYLSPSTKTCKSMQKLGKTLNVKNNNRLGAQRIDMGKLGVFDIYVDQSGTGYYIKHVESGESVEVSIVRAEAVGQTAAEEYIAIDSFVPIEQDKKSYSFKNQLKSAFMYQSPDNRAKVRRVLIADMFGNAFECKIQLQALSKDTSSSDSIGQIPCLPAAYGETTISFLRNSMETGLQTEAKIFAPDYEDPFGCHEDWEDKPVEDCDTEIQKVEMHLKNETSRMEEMRNSEPNEEEFLKMKRNLSDLESKIRQLSIECAGDQKPPRVQLVERGKCNFRAKGFNALDRHNAKAMVVINNDPKGLFIMAGALTKSQELRNQEEPLSVLVTGEDGNDILQTIEKYNSKGQDIVANITITPRLEEADNELNVNGDNTNWPKVQTATNSIQIYASQGWGVGAYKQNNNAWQIVLLEHKKEATTSTM